MAFFFILQFLIDMYKHTIPLDCFTELLMALDKIRNKSMKGVVRIPVSDKVLKLLSHR